MICRSEFSDMILAESARRTSVRQGLHRVGTRCRLLQYIPPQLSPPVSPRGSRVLLSMTADAWPDPSDFLLTCPIFYFS